MIADRTWEPIGERMWGLCVGFGHEPDGVYLAVSDGPMETEDAMRWVLAELAVLARDRAKRYADQLYAIMNEAAR